MKKRILPTLLAICMLIAMAPSAFAVQVSTPSEYYWATEPSTVPQILPDGSTYDHDVYPGDIVWKCVENGSNQYNLCIYLGNQAIGRTTYSGSATEKSGYYIAGDFRSQPRESGNYTFTLQALGDGNAYTDGEIVTSMEFSYVRPEAQLDTPTDLRWDGATAHWDEVEGACGYGVRWYYAETADGEFAHVGDVITYWGDSSTNTWEELPDWVLTNHGAGYYAFEVCAISRDITKICPSEQSARSAVYATDGATTSVSDSLNDIMDGLGQDPAENAIAAAIDSVKALDNDDLRVALEADKDNNGVTAQIQKLEDLSGIGLTTTVEESVGIAADQISLTGAKLNADADQVTFRVSKPAEEVVVPGAYSNTVQFDFGLTGASVEADGEFAVPIKIKIPVPSGIDPSRLRILHYTAAGTYEEVIFPAISQEDGIFYATFVVKHFSTFVFAEAAPAAAIGDTHYASLQDAIDGAQSGAKIHLCRNYEDTATVKVEGKSLDIYGGVYTIDPDVVTVGVDCTKTVTGTDGSDQIISVVYNPSGSSSGSGGGGSSSIGNVLNKPSTAVNGAGGKVTASNNGTVTIKPDDGYQISSITVNGKEVAIPSDGKLTGLDRDDHVVVTFKKIASGMVGAFLDVSVDAWYADAVQYAIDKGIMNGVSETVFSPNSTTTRGMIVTMLHRMEDTPSAGTSDFTDVSVDVWYADAVAWAAANGVVNGTTERNFAPDSAITREQLATILYRYALYKGYNVSVSNTVLNEYTDTAQISAYALEAMQWANATGLIMGNTATTINPTGNATRAEVATILMRFCENII